jgi:TonB family protein
MCLWLRQFIRPTPGAALAASLWIHAASFAAAMALELWMFPASESVEFSGKRNVVQIELALSSPAATVPIPAVNVEPLSDVNPLPHQAMPERSSPVLAAPVTEMQVSRRERSLVEAEELAVESLQEEGRAPAAAVARREMAAHLPSPSQSEPKWERRPSPSPAPSVPQVSAPQIAGTDDQTPPDLSGNRKPEYPAAAYRNGIEGMVLLRLWIDDSGRVSRVDVEQSSGHALLDRAAVTAVRTWRGRPAHRGEEPIATEELLPVHFRIASR